MEDLRQIDHSFVEQKSDSDEGELYGLMFEGSDPQTYEMQTESGLETSFESENQVSNFMNYDFAKVWTQAPKLPAKEKESRRRSTLQKKKSIKPIRRSRNNSRKHLLNDPPKKKKVERGKRESVAPKRSMERERNQQNKTHGFTDLEKLEELKVTVAKLRDENRLVEALVLSKQVISAASTSKKRWSSIEMRKAAYDVVKLSNALTKQNKKRREDIEMCLEFLEYSLEVLDQATSDDTNGYNGFGLLDDSVFEDVAETNELKKFTSKWTEIYYNLKIVTLNNVASSYRELGFLERAKSKAKQAITISKYANEVGVGVDKDAEACTNLILCTLYSSQSKHQEALEYAKVAVHTLEDIFKKGQDLSKQETVHMIESLVIAYYNVGAESEHILQGGKHANSEINPTPWYHQAYAMARRHPRLFPRETIRKFENAMKTYMGSKGSKATQHHFTEKLYQKTSQEKCVSRPNTPFTKIELKAADFFRGCGGRAYKTFQDMDENKNGTLSRKEIRLGIDLLARQNGMLGFFRDQEVEELINCLDKNHDEQIMFAEIARIMDYNNANPNTQTLTSAEKVMRALQSLKEQKMERVIDMFAAMDTNDDGLVDLSEFTMFCRNHGLKLKKKEIKNVMQQIDQKGTFKITYDELLSFVNHGIQENGSKKTMKEKENENNRMFILNDSDLTSTLNFLDSFSLDEFIAEENNIANTNMLEDQEVSWYINSTYQDNSVKEFLKGPVPMAVAGWRAAKPSTIADCIKENGKLLHWPPMIRGEEVNSLLIPKDKSTKGNNWGETVSKMVFANLDNNVKSKNSPQSLAREVFKNENSNEKFSVKLETFKQYLK